MLRALSVAALTVTLAACSSQQAPDPGRPAAAPSTSVAPLDPAALAPRVVEDAPSGFSLADDAVGRTGPTDLAAAAADTSDPGAAAALAESGFVRGYQRLWVGEDDEDELFLLVYEFADPAGADAFFERTVGDAAAEGGEGVFEVPGVPGAVGVSGGGDGLAVRAVVLTEGPFLVQVIGNGPVPGPSQGTVVALAAAQAQRLG